MRKRKISPQNAGLALVFVTALLKWLLVDYLNLRVIFIPIIISTWGSLIIYNKKQNSNYFIDAGFGKLGLKTSLFPVFVYILSLSGLLLGYAKLFHIQVFSKNLFVAMALYPIWGLIQQFIVMNFVLTPLRDKQLSKPLVIAVSALAFGSIHLPDLQLFIATVIAGVFFSLIFYRYKNLWPLGFAHGILASLLYYWYLNLDPIQDIFKFL